MRKTRYYGVKMWIFGVSIVLCALIRVSLPFLSPAPCPVGYIKINGVCICDSDYNRWILDYNWIDREDDDLNNEDQEKNNETDAFQSYESFNLQVNSTGNRRYRFNIIILYI